MRGRSDRRDSGRADQGANQRLGDFGLQQLRAARPFRVEDDLRIGNIGKGVERRMPRRIEAADNERCHDGKNGKAKPDDAPNDAGEHRLAKLAFRS